MNSTLYCGLLSADNYEHSWLFHFVGLLERIFLILFLYAIAGQARPYLMPSEWPESKCGQLLVSHIFSHSNSTIFCLGRRALYADCRWQWIAFQFLYNLVGRDTWQWAIPGTATEWPWIGNGVILDKRHHRVTLVSSLDSREFASFLVTRDLTREF